MKDATTNILGTLDVTNAVLPHMRARKSGTVVLMGSRSGWRSELPVCPFGLMVSTILRTVIFRLLVSGFPRVFVIAGFPNSNVLVKGFYASTKAAMRGKSNTISSAPTHTVFSLTCR